MSYYAEYNAYGMDTSSDCDCLARFQTKAERDEWVERYNNGAAYAHETVWHAVTTREIAHKYNLNDFNGDWRCSEFERPDVTSAGRSVHYIPPRRNYEF